MFSTFHRAASILSILMLSVTGPMLSAQTADRAPPGEEVRFPSDPGTMLAGTLETPRGFGAGHSPVVILISGTGPWTRGGWINIRSRLLASGIAVFQYDKRGQGRSTGAFIDTIPAMERDVAAAIAFLRTRRDIDPRRIALVGISQGAVAAPLVASRDPAIAAVVMLSGPVGPRGELFLSILRSHLRNAGKVPADVERVAGAVGSWMEGRSRRTGAADIRRLRQAAVAAFAGAGFLRPQAEGFVSTLEDDVVLSMYEAAPDRALAAVRAPILAIYGSRDDVIAPDLSFAAATAALGDHPDALVVAVPGMTHELQRAAAAPAGSAPVEDSTMPVVTEIVGGWLAKRLRAGPPDR
jgi:pimeloyl-ACP methyl ester carboxylesterase